MAWTNVIGGQNLFTHSTGTYHPGSFDNADGNFIGETENYCEAPDGSNDGFRLQWYKGTEGSAYAGVSIGVGNSTSKIRTYSIFVKSNTSNTQTIQFRTLGSIRAVTILAIPEWKRFSITNPAATTSTYMQLWTPSSASYTTNVDVSIWGYQLEEGSVFSTHIPVSGATKTYTGSNGIWQYDDEATTSDTYKDSADGANTIIKNGIRISGKPGLTIPVLDGNETNMPASVTMNYLKTRKTGETKERGELSKTYYDTQG